MICEIKNPVTGKDSVRIAALVSIPSKSKLSDQLFLRDCGSKNIRPIVESKEIDGMPGLNSNLGLSDENFLIYCEKIGDIILDLQPHFSKLVFIDVRLGNDFEEDVVVNHLGGAASSYIVPVIKNLEFSSTKWAENVQSDLKFIDKVVVNKKGLSAFQLAISSKLFESNPESALRIFEEAVIFSHLSVTGQI